MGAGTAEKRFRPRVAPRDLCLVDQGMNATTHTVNESDGTTRRIDDDRLTRALTDDMTVREHAPGQYLVARDGDDHDEHLVDVDAGACDCSDAHYRDVVCVHLARASLHHAYRQARNTRLVARVLAAVRELGCPHDVAGCGGPTDEGQRGLPCEGCIAATPGHWVVYQRLANGKVVDLDVDRGAGAVTDGGRDIDSLREMVDDEDEGGLDAHERAPLRADCHDCGFVAQRSTLTSVNHAAVRHREQTGHAVTIFGADGARFEDGRFVDRGEGIVTDGGAVIAEGDTPTDDNVCAPCQRCGSYGRVDAITAENHMVCAECSRTGGSR